MPVFIQEFSSHEDIIRKFEAEPEALNDCDVLLAWYGYGPYCGTSIVVYRKNGVLYEVNGHHCSCYGLEGQWEPEVTSVDALKMRTFYSDHDGAEEAKNAMNVLIAQLETGNVPQ